MTIGHESCQNYLRKWIEGVMCELNKHTMETHIGWLSGHMATLASFPGQRVAVLLLFVHALIHLVEFH